MAGFPDKNELYKVLGRKAYDGVMKGDYALLGAYLPREVLEVTARLAGEYRNSFGYRDGSAVLNLVSPILSNVLDNVRNRLRPNHRWCVLVKNVAQIFEMTRGSLCGADLSELDLTECDLSEVALGSLGLVANLKDSLIRFDSFVSYRVPGLRAGEKPEVALDVSEGGRIMMACGGVLLEISAENPMASRVVCDLSSELGRGWRICKLRFSENGQSLLITATDDLNAFDATTSLHPDPDYDPAVRQWLFDGANLILCHDERTIGPGAVLRSHGGEGYSAYLESWELARFRERHCWELETGDPTRDELTARDRLFSGNLRYKYENERITDRWTRTPLAFVRLRPRGQRLPKNTLCVVNPTARECDLGAIHPDSPITPEQLAILMNG